MNSTNVTKLCASLSALTILSACGDAGSGGDPATRKPLASATTSATTSSASTFTASEIFRGVFFSKGPVAARLPHLTATHANPDDVAHSREEIQKAIAEMADDGLSPRAQETAKLLSSRLDSARPAATPESSDAAISAIESRLVASDPEILERFKSDMTSGDHVRIAQALDTAAKQVAEVVLDWHKAENGGKDAPNLWCETCAPDTGGFALNVDSFVNVVTVVNVDGAVNVRIAYNIDTFKNKYLVRATDARSGKLLHDTVVDDIAQNLS